MRLSNGMHTRLSIVALAFMLNLVWENAQAPLFNGYQNFVQHFMPCLWATVGDAIIIFLLYEVYASLCKDRNWITHVKKGQIVMLMIMGVILAIFMEWRALVSGRWSYAESMPIIPLLGVGLLPVLQMMFLPLITFYGIAKFNKN